MPSVEERLRYWRGRAVEAENEFIALKAAAAPALNYIENTENELGITLRSGDLLRAALASLPDRTGEPVAEPSDDDLVRRGDVFAVVQMMLEQFDSTENNDLRTGLHSMITDIPALATPPDAEQARLRERVEPVKAHPAEARMSIIARQVRETLRRYGHKTAESSLPECIGADVNAALKAAEARLAQQAERAPAVTVKPLEWEYVERATMTYTAFWADGDVAYYIDQGFGSDSYYFRTIQWPEETIYDGDDLEAAKKAAQKAHEARILSALAEPQQAVTEAMTELERALCQFTNAASDQYDPSVWVPETKRNFEALCEAYDKAYTAGCFPVPAALRTSSTGGKG